MSKNRDMCKIWYILIIFLYRISPQILSVLELYTSTRCETLKRARIFVLNTDNHVLDNC